ncbi:MAG: hypothetical protein ACRC1K_07940 [Planctomycetia bacterium]
MTFKSYQEALDLEAVEELFGHYINYRKQVSAAAQKGDGLLPKSNFRLFAVCVRRPSKLLKWGFLSAVAPGVYDTTCHSNPVRIVVVRELPLVKHNAVLHLFSVDRKRAMYGAANYRPYSGFTSTLLLNFAERYEKEGKSMVGKELLEMHRRTVKEVMRKASLEERLEGVPVEQLLARLTDDDLRNLSPEVRDELLRRLTGQPKPSSPS